MAAMWTSRSRRCASRVISARAHVLIAVDTTDEKKRARSCSRGWRRREPFLRRQLAAALDAKKTPTVRFSIDDTDSRADRVERLLEEIAAERNKSEE